VLDNDKIRRGDHSEQGLKEVKQPREHPEAKQVLNKMTKNRNMAQSLGKQTPGDSGEADQEHREGETRVRTFRQWRLHE
jgi:tartrate dehydratase alpha subunit/fumarate hydratase class I-like protein